jgi:hypothetical protein
MKHHPYTYKITFADKSTLKVQADSLHHLINIIYAMFNKPFKITSMEDTK